MAKGRDELRAADADRARAAARLRVALDEGRLTLTEYDERLQQAYAAKTYGELDSLFADLPVAPAESSQIAPAGTAPSAEQGASRAEVGRWLAGVWGAWLIAVVINVIIWAAVSLGSGDLVYFWPIWVGGPWGAVLLAITISGLLSGKSRRLTEIDQRRADRWARRQARRRARRQAWRGY